MNERIKELAQVAEHLADNELAHLERVHNRLYSFTEGREILMEKFAELIIQECLKVCKKTEQYEVGNQDPDEVGCIRAGAVFCRDDIKEHFGVEGR
jgi:hypothetical protein